METEKNPQRTQESWHKYKIACLSLLSGYWYLATYSSDQTRFTDFDLFSTVLLLVVALLAQVGLLSLARHRRVVLDLSAGFFAVVNLFVLYLSFVLPILHFEWYLQVFVFVSAWLFAMLFFSSFANGERWRKLLIGATFALFVFQFAVAASFNLRNHLSRQHLLSTTTEKAENMTSSPNVRLVEFTQKPNVYLLSFDAMLPEALASELLDIPSLPYARTLEENDFLLFPNYFSDDNNTLATFARVFAIDPQYAALGEHHSINAGQKPSPLREIFRSNGYQTHLYTDSYRLSHEVKGDDYDWDYFEIANLLTSACAHMINKPLFVFYGYCYFIEVAYDTGYIEHGIWDEQKYVAFFLDTVAKRLEPGGQHLFVSYFKTPGHTDFILYKEQLASTRKQLAEFKETYKQEAEVTAVAMEEIINFVRENDPDAWLFFFSDHGTLMLNHELDDVETVGRRRRLLDNYGGLAAFYPPQACPDHVVPRQWSTTSMITHEILRCLADGTDLFVNDVTYQYVEDDIDLTDYLYE